MSEFHVNVIKLGPLSPHPNAETLNIVKVFDYQVITKNDWVKEGDLVVYIPVDSVVPDTEEWHWLCPLDSEGKPRYPVGQVPVKYRVVEAKKLRGIFSQGMLSPVPNGSVIEGDDVAELMGITKYEPPPPVSIGGECEAAPQGWTFITYTDIEGLRRYPDVLKVGEDVVITEKIHGANSRYVHDGERLWVGSHTQIKKYDPKNVFWQTAIAEGLEEKLSRFPRHIVFGEVFGQVQDLKYDVKSGCKFRAFDVFSLDELRFLDHEQAMTFARDCDLVWAPTLYCGPWDPDVNNLLAEGQSTFANNVREGFIVKPMKERWDSRVGRVILKRHGEGYLLRKKK